MFLLNTATTSSIVRTMQQIALGDIFNVLVIALLIYTLFLFFRRAKTYYVFWGIGISILLYVTATFFNLSFTSLGIRDFTSILAVALIIIFQPEIRKYIEVLGLIGSRQFKVGHPNQKSPITTELVQACVQMAQTRTGALIVLQADNNIANFTEGGIELDGLISEELIVSIFDHHSSGHDGAMIISNNRIIRFGAQLPLSTNFKEIGKHGTRHSAAVGLTEASDALCIICSEEKGTISIAKEGKLKTLVGYEKLEKELDKYINSQKSKPENFIVHFINHNTALKVISLALAIAIWFFVA